MGLDLDWIAAATGARAVHEEARIQALWSGYGELVRVRLTGAPMQSAVVKWVRAPARSARRASDISHARKHRSYDVETTFYRAYAARCDSICRVPALLDCRQREHEWLLLLEDLDASGYSGRRSWARPQDIERCLGWLAAFHARFLGVAPEGLWENGTYWHLATRPDELAAIEDETLREAAATFDKKLRAAEFQTLVHGDAKLENFCFAENHSNVAAVDFQYTGAGCGMKDVAYFLSSCSASGEEVADARYLDTYFERLRAALAPRSNSMDIDALESEWRALYPMACADFYRFLAGWSRAEWQRDRVGQRLVRAALRALD
jgi:hypothetical protein